MFGYNNLEEHYSARIKCTSNDNKTKDWALVQNAASAGVKVKLGLFR